MICLIIEIENKKHWEIVNNELKEHFSWANYYYQTQYTVGFNLVVSLPIVDTTFREKYKIYHYSHEASMHLLENCFCKDVNELLIKLTANKLGLI